MDQQEGVTVVSCDVGAVAPGASAEAVLTIRLDPGASGVLANEASVGSGALDPETADNVAGVQSTITAAVSTSVTKTGPAVLVPGRSATYTLAYRNDGPSTATDIVLADQIPDGLEFSAAPGCSLVGAGPVFVTCAVDPLGPGGSGQVEITFLVADSAVDGATILNAASIVAAGTESDQADNSSVVSGLVDTEPPGGTSEQPSGSGVTTSSLSPTETSSASTSTASGTSTDPTPAPTTLSAPQPGSGGSAGSGLSSTGVAVGGLLTVAALLLAAGLAFGLFGRRPGRRH